VRENTHCSYNYPVIISNRKVSRHPNVVKGCPEAIFQHCLVTYPEPFSISRRLIWLDLVFEKLTKFLLKVRLLPLLWWWWWWWGRRRRSTFISGTRINLGIQPHVSQHLAYAFFNVWTEVGIACQRPNLYYLADHTKKRNRHVHKCQRTDKPLSRSHACIISWARIEPVNNLYVWNVERVWDCGKYCFFKVFFI